MSISGLPEAHHTLGISQGKRCSVSLVACQKKQCSLNLDFVLLDLGFFVFCFFQMKFSQLTINIPYFAPLWCFLIKYSIKLNAK